MGSSATTRPKNGKSQHAPAIFSSIEVNQNPADFPSYLGGGVGERGGEERVNTFEQILEDLGCFGPFQSLTLFAYLFMEIAAAFVAFIPILVARSTSLTNCTASYDDNVTTFGTTPIPPPTFPTEQVTGTTSNTVTSTDGWAGAFIPYHVKSLADQFTQVFQAPFQYESLVDEWDLKCDRAWIPDVFTSLLMAGMAIGNVVWSGMADWYGRRPAYFLIIFILFLGTILAAISPNIYFYGVARFIAGSGFSGFLNVSYMAVMEFMTPQWRSLANMVGPIGEGMVLLSLLGYYIRPWRKLYLMTLVPYILIVPIYFILPESPRWLLRNKRVKEAHAVLGYIAKVNGRQPVSMLTLEALRKHEELATQSQNQKVSYLDFIRTPQLFKTSMFLFAMWFSWNVGYYGISYNIRNVPGSVYVNLALIGLANSLGQRASMPVSDWFGRRRAVLYGMTLAAGFLVGLAICFLTVEEVSGVVILAVCFIGLFGLSSVRASLRLLSGESFPTSVRTMGLGVGGLGANCAGLLTPQTAYLGSKWPALPFFIFATVSVIGSLVVLMMKETTGNPLSDEIQGKRKKSVAGKA